MNKKTYNEISNLFCGNLICFTKVKAGLNNDAVRITKNGKFNPSDHPGIFRYKFLSLLSFFH